MTNKRIVLTTNARVNGVLRSPPEGELTVTEGEAKRLVQVDKAAHLAPGEKWSRPRAKAQGKAPAPKKASAPPPPPEPAKLASGSTAEPAAAPSIRPDRG